MFSRGKQRLRVSTMVNHVQGTQGSFQREENNRNKQLQKILLNFEIRGKKFQVLEDTTKIKDLFFGLLQNFPP
jgi:hypothetical protein